MAASPALRWLKRLGWLLIAALLIAIGNAVNNNLKEYYQDVLLQCGFAIILAVSLNIVNGLTGQFSIGHAGFMAVGAYTGASITYQVALQSHVAKPGLPWMLLAMTAGGLCAALAGYIVGVPSLRLRGDYLAIVTLGFGEIIRVILENIGDINASLSFTGGASGFQNIPTLSTFGIVTATLIVVIVLTRNLKFSSHGLAFMSIREDEIAADAMGVNTTRIKVTAFVLSAFFAGVGGVLFAHYKAIKPDTFGFVLSMNYVVMIVLGGTGSITGATMAAIGLTILPELLKPVKDKVPFFTDEYRQVIYALLLVLMMILRPTGVFGTGELSLAGLRRWLRRGKTPVTSFAEGLTAEGNRALEDTSSISIGDALEEGNEPTGANVEVTRSHSSTSAIQSSFASSASAPSMLDCSDILLDVADLTRRFGGLTAVGNVNLQLRKGELVGLIGPNGAGKTTVFNLLTGVYEPSEGRLDFDDQPLAGQRPTPPTTRMAGLALDTIIAATAGWIISTIMATAIVPAATTPEAVHLQTIIRWLGPIIGIAASLATLRKRRKFVPGYKPYRFALRGISRTFQNIRMFADLTVLENVRIGTYLRRQTNVFDALFRTARMEREEAANIEKARRLLAEFNLLRVQDEQAKNLPYGDQRRLEIVRALATDPKLLLLDEPAAGMNPQEKVQLMHLIRRVRDEYGLTILLIEHDMKLVMGICERIYVLDYGRIIAEGTPQEIRSNSKVVAAYLGEESE